MHKLTSLKCDLVHHNYCTAVVQHSAPLHLDLKTGPTIKKPHAVNSGVNHTDCAVILEGLMCKELLWQCMP